MAGGVAACGDESLPGAGGDGGDGGFVSFEEGGGVPIDALTIDPPMATLVVKAGGAAQTQTFRARGQVGAGAPFDVPAVFTIDNAGPGSMTGAGVFTTNNLAGGLVNVKAEYNGKSANAVLIVKLEADETSGMVPMNPDALFDPMKNKVVTNDPMGSPSLVYPVNETKFPQNLYRTMFNWRGGAGNNLFMLKYESQYLTLNVYSDGVHPTCVTAASGGKCWETVQKQWTMIALSNAGSNVKLTVYGTNTNAPGTIYASKAYDFSFSKSPVPGAIYYWSTTVAGTRRGTLSDQVPSNFLTPPEADGKCVACHTLSRNGKRLAADVGGHNLWVVEVVKTIPPPRVFTSYMGQQIPNGWATFNPDTSRVISASKGVLRLLDGNSGAPIGGNNGVITGPMPYGTMPDWSPNGKHIAFAESTSSSDRKLTASSIVIMDAMNDMFSNRQVIVQSSGVTDNHSYPMFSPTSDWLALTWGTKSTDNDATSQIYVAPVKPNATKDMLVRANTLVNDGVVMSGIQNNMPTWAPTSADGIQWVAFTSTRDYGTILAQNSKYGSGRDQLWIAAIDVSKLGQGDPSFPAFRVPFLELGEHCHRPFWAEDAFVPPPDGGADAGPCVMNGDDCTMGICCNGLQCLPVGNTYKCSIPPPTDPRPTPRFRRAVPLLPATAGGVAFVGYAEAPRSACRRIVSGADSVSLLMSARCQRNERSGWCIVPSSRSRDETLVVRFARLRARRVRDGTKRLW